MSSNSMSVSGKYCVELCVESEKLIKDTVHDLKACVIGQKGQGYTNTVPEL